MTKISPEDCEHEFVEYLVTKGEVLEISVVDNRYEARIRKQEALAECQLCGLEDFITEWDDPIVTRRGGHVVW